jgi:hypothetical protein
MARHITDIAGKGMAGFGVPAAVARDRVLAQACNPLLTRYGPASTMDLQETVARPGSALLLGTYRL